MGDANGRPIAVVGGHCICGGTGQLRVRGRLFEQGGLEGQEISKEKK
jgi:hypothetical protein